jgi:cytochrome P450
MWSLYYLAVHLDEQARVADEVDRVLGDRAATADDVASLSFVEMAFKEAMRLRGPVYFFGREAAEHVEIGGYEIPRGSQVHLVPYVTHHDARWFEEPEEFRPERFSPEREARLPPCAYFPFGAGPRVCIGKGMAMMEGTLILATIFQRFRVSLAAGQGDPGAEAQVSLHPRGPLRLRLEPRRHAAAMPGDARLATPS